MKTTTLKTGVMLYFSGGETNEFIFIPIGSNQFLTWIFKNSNNFKFKPPQEKSDKTFSTYKRVFF